VIGGLVSSALGSPSADARGHGFFKAVNFTLEELPSLIKRLNLYIAVDTGPIYIAHALKVPLIDITGPCDSNEQPPNDELSIQVRPPPYIKPSSFVMKKPGKPAEHEKALESTHVEDVFLAIEKLSQPVFKE
jgi:ADP-heptose:LPS heptosyltransferase